MAKPPPITRNLTLLFVRCRQERFGAAGRTQLGKERVGDRLLSTEADGRGHGDIEMAASTLPPQWTDAATEAREDIKAIKEKLVQLSKAQQKRLLKVFVDDAAPDKDVEVVSSQISSLVRRCEQSIHQVKTRGRGGVQVQQDGQIRENLQRNLATQLQTLSQVFRQAQKDYLNEIRKRQRGGMWDDGPASGGGGGGGGGGAGAADVGFTDSQMHELEGMEIDATQRNREIHQIATSISDLHTIFKELAVLVIDQGSILDRIDYNIEQVVHQSVEANKQLKKAEDSQKSNRAMKCIMILVLINLILIVVLIIKSRH